MLFKSLDCLRQRFTITITVEAINLAASIGSTIYFDNWYYIYLIIFDQLNLCFCFLNKSFHFDPIFA